MSAASSIPSPIDDGNLAPKTGAAIGRWSFADLAGRLIEISGLAATTMAIGMVHEAQQKMEPAAWITCRGSTFYPPDVQETGVDLDALPVLFVADESCAARAADQLLRSGAFGLVVLDLGVHSRVPMPLQTRLVGLARKHDAAVLFLTEPEGMLHVRERRLAGSARSRAGSPPRARRGGGSLASLISLRTEARRDGSDAGRYRYVIEAIKDKRHGPGWFHQELRRGPSGVC